MSYVGIQVLILSKLKNIYIWENIFLQGRISGSKLEYSSHRGILTVEKNCAGRSDASLNNHQVIIFSISWSFGCRNSWRRCDNLLPWLYNVLINTLVFKRCPKKDLNFFWSCVDQERIHLIEANVPYYKSQGKLSIQSNLFKFEWR